VKGAVRENRPLTPAAFADRMGLAPDTLARLEAYAALLVQWQGAVNLVGRDTLDDLWRRHMLDSAQLVPHLPEGAEILTDLGSGAGFPGMVLAIVTGLRVHLVEATGRKAAFLREAARVTGARAEVHHGRIESLAPWPTDVITARALAPLPLLLDYAAPLLAASAGRDPVCLFLKGASARQELTEARKTWTMTAKTLPSLSDEAGMVLKLHDIFRRDPAETGRR
jgi:16S rRNA (guanine527-N7)-methyltransferase